MCSCAKSKGARALARSLSINNPAILSINALYLELERLGYRYDQVLAVWYFQQGEKQNEHE